MYNVPMFCAQTICFFIDISLTCLWQNLLQRHEIYIAEAEQDRKQLTAMIDKLTKENTELESRNQRTIGENRNLLDELETLNNAIKDSESKVTDLTEVLNSTEQELERINGLASRTEQLQLQISQLEDDLDTANKLAGTTKEENRAAVLHWQEAERAIIRLNVQIERIEAEAKSERDRHADMLERVERRKAVELALLQKRPPRQANDPNSSAVVSHFVKDILQDNANLQMGIVELKELLNRSNDEVERLRDHMLLPPGDDEPIDRSATQTPTLGAELAGKTELHVHHHYHPPNDENKTPRPAPTRRSRKKRSSLSSRSHTPRSSISLARPQSPSSNSAILSQTSVTIPKPKRWSVQSNQTGFTSSSSLPSSPYADSIFDRVFGPEAATDTSRPSSPESSSTFSPRFPNELSTFELPRHHSRTDSGKSIPAQSINRTMSEGSAPRLPQASAGRGSISAGKQAVRDQLTILEDIEELESSQHLQNAQQSPVRLAASMEPTSPIKIPSPMRPQAPTLRRSASHESLISISGMDIHTLRARPSQLLFGQYASSAITSSTKAAVTDMSAMAHLPGSNRASQARSTSQSYLSTIAASAQKERTVSRKPSRSSLPGRVGGWVFGRWGVGVAPTSAPDPSLMDSDAASTSTSTPPSTSAGLTARTSSTGSVPSSLAQKDPSSPDILSESPLRPVFRTFGVNQPGPIFGFPIEKRLDRNVVVKGLDVDALREGLGGD
jgi:hypothetical protein